MVSACLPALSVLSAFASAVSAGLLPSPHATPRHVCAQLGPSERFFDLDSFLTRLMVLRKTLRAVCDELSSYYVVGLGLWSFAGVFMVICESLRCVLRSVA